MHSLWRRIVITAAFTLALVGSASAQSAVDPNLLNDVASAFAQTAAVDSLHLESQSLTETATGQDTSFGAVLASSYDLVRSSEAWNLSGSQTTDTTTPNGSFQSVTEMIVIDGTVYMRIQREGDAANAAPGNANGFSLPEGWFDLSALQADGQGQPGAGAFLGGAAGGLPNSLLDVLLVPVTASGVVALSELPADAIDGQAMRVFQVTFDSQAILDSDAASLARGAAGFAGAGPGGRQFGSGQQGQRQGQPADVTPQFEARPTVSPENVNVSFAVYIGEDGLIHRIYSVAAITSAPVGDAAVGLSTTTTTVTDFSAFNQPVEIVAPTIGI